MGTARRFGLPEQGLDGCIFRRPGIPEPEGRQNIKRRSLRTSVESRDPHQNIFRQFLSVLHEHIEVTVRVKNPGIKEFIFHFIAAAASVGKNQDFVGESLLVRQPNHISFLDEASCFL
jgi:hypothetical protein